MHFIFRDLRNVHVQSKKDKRFDQEPGMNFIIHIFSNFSNFSVQ